MTDKNARQYRHYDPEQLEDEIELIDLLRVVWKWKYLAIGGTMLCVVLAALVSVLLPETYRIDMLIDSGLVAGKVRGQPVYLVESKELKAVIASGKLNHKILEMIQGNNNSTDSSGNISFKAQVLGGTNVLKVSNNAKNPDLGLKALLNLHELLQQEYSVLLEYEQENFREKELSVSKEIDNLKQKITIKKQELISIPTKKKQEGKVTSLKLSFFSKKKMLHQERIKELEQRASELAEDIKKVSAEIEFLAEIRQGLLRGKNQNLDSLSVILYISTVQKMYEHLGTLKSEVLATKHNIQRGLINIYSFDSEVENVKAQLDDFMEKMNAGTVMLTNEIEDLKDIVELKQEKLIKLQQMKKDTQNIRLIQAPSGGEKPIKPKTTQNVILGGVAGFFLMIFLAFFIEYIQKHGEVLDSLTKQTKHQDKE